MSDQWLECAFLIPIRQDANLSEGELHSTEAWEWLDNELFEAFDGVTLAPGLYAGAYRDPDTGERVNDESRRFVVAMPAASTNELREMLKQACVVFQQKCIYLSVAGSVELVSP
jgi:hypothetical protein